MLQYLSDLIDYLSQMPLSLQAVLLTGTVLLILQTVVLGRNARRRLLRLQSQPDQKEMIQDTKRHMMMPPQPSAHLIVTHTDMLFAFLETRFNRPPHTADADQGFRRYVYRRVTQVGLQFTADDVPPQDQPDLWPWQFIVDSNHPQECKISDDGPLAAFLDRVARPFVSRLVLRDRRNGLRKSLSFYQSFACRFASLARPLRHRRSRAFQPNLGIVRDFCEYHSPIPATLSKRLVSRPKASSQANQRPRNVPSSCTASIISHLDWSLVLNSISLGTPHFSRRSA